MQEELEEKKEDSIEELLELIKNYIG